MTANDEAAALREREWAQTKIGRLFYAYEQTRSMAWVIDQSDASKRAKAAWAKADAARAAFLTAWRGFP